MTSVTYSAGIAHRRRSAERYKSWAPWWSARRKTLADDRSSAGLQQVKGREKRGKRGKAGSNCLNALFALIAHPWAAHPETRPPNARSHSLQKLQYFRLHRVE